MAIKSFEALYKHLGQKNNYTSKEVADSINVEQWRKHTKIKGKNYKFDCGPVSSLVEAEGKSLDELGANITKTLHRFYREQVERTLEGLDVRSFRIETFAADRTDSEQFKIIARTEDVVEYEEDHKVYARLVAELTQRAARDREAERQKDQVEQGKIMKLRDFKRTLKSMNLDDVEKDKLIKQFNETHGIEEG